MNKFEGGEKVNFVDKNNVFVGYDLAQSCCEQADWFILDTEQNIICEKMEGLNLDDYVFDKNYFEKVVSNNLDEGKMVRFKLLAKDKPDLFLHLFNGHNGYYCHGFEAKIGDMIWKDGVL